ncbi:MAG: 2,3-bisphosphoglycerate-independent phosphoglycerate mutase, partial [Anaplasmataceae bacterium]|nr:2,3-bisphosphoglycerate-independent phosphoglycerate mutase [Anaplasmataceae bacterium]
MSRQKVFLCILDGWGLSDNKQHNAIYLGNTPNMDYVMKNYPFSKLEASGNAVGLPHGQISNSEIGHMTIGAGRVINTDLVKINKEITNIENNENIIKYIDKIKKNGGNIHIIGLLSDGGIHSHINHIKIIDNYCQNSGIKTFIHAITDGRDCDQQSAKKFVDNIDNIITVSGRYYAMDRDNNLERTTKYFENILYGNGKKFSSPEKCIEYHYDLGITDEFINPSIIENTYESIKSEDGIIICNYRADRTTQILKLLLSDEITKNNILGLVPYSKDLQINTIFIKKSLSNTLGEVLAQNN